MRLFIVLVIFLFGFNLNVLAKPTINTAPPNMSVNLNQPKIAPPRYSCINIIEKKVVVGRDYDKTLGVTISTKYPKKLIDFSDGLKSDEKVIEVQIVGIGDNKSIGDKPKFTNYRVEHNENGWYFVADPVLNQGKKEEGMVRFIVIGYLQ